MDKNTGERILVEIDRELMSIIPAYLEKSCRDCAEIDRLLASGGMEDIRIMGHRLRGSGGSYGFDVISAIGESLELAAQACDAEGVKSAVGCLEEYLANVSVSYI